MNCKPDDLCVVIYNESMAGLEDLVGRFVTVRKLVHALSGLPSWETEVPTTFTVSRDVLFRTLDGPLPVRSGTQVTAGCLPDAWLQPIGRRHARTDDVAEALEAIA